MDTMQSFFDSEYYGNTVRQYTIVLSIIVGGLLILRIFKKLILRRLRVWARKSEAKWDDFIVDAFSKFIFPLFYFGVIYWALQYLVLSPLVDKILHAVTAAVIIISVVRMITTTVEYLLVASLAGHERGEERAKQLRGVIIIVNFVIWGIGLLALFDNLGYDVTAIIAGLGIGGIAVALAAQNILGDLFNYLVIFFDRPFEIGDFVLIDDKMGTVEYIGIKTTRIKSLSGEQLVFSNSDLTSSRLHNFKKMGRRRVLYALGVEYSTPLEKLKLIPVLVKEIIESHERVTFDRVHFSAYRDYSLEFELVYYIESSDYNIFMDLKQSINLKIFETFAKEEIAFAFPTQSLHLVSVPDSLKMVRE